MEGWHNRINNRITATHGDFWLFMVQMKEEQEFEVVYYTQLEEGGVARPRRQVDKTKERAIKYRKRQLRLALQQVDINGSHNNAILLFLQHLVPNVGNFHLDELVPMEELAAAEDFDPQQEDGAPPEVPEGAQMAVAPDDPPANNNPDDPESEGEESDDAASEVADDAEAELNGYDAYGYY